MLSLIVAMTPEGVIGRRGDLPWRLSTDLRRFRALTMGHAILMGRKTYESIGRALPGRSSIVITRQNDFQVAEGVLVAKDLDAALQLAADDAETFVIGGAQIYALALPRADRLYLTRVEAQVEGDTHFPPLEMHDWYLVEEETFAADEKNEYATRFQILDRIPANGAQQ